MDAKAWWKLAALLLYAIAFAIVLSKCTRVFETAPEPTPPPSKSKTPPNPENEPPPSAEERRRLKEQEEHTRRVDERRKAYDRREAELKTLRQTHLPVAIAELATEATRYRNKLSDLPRLTEPERWEREVPVKEALAHAKQLLVDDERIDREAQKERPTATEYSDDEVQSFMTRLAEFKRGGEELAKFAGALPVFIGHVPEPLIVSAVEAVAHSVLPPNAFDPCRDPKACPKPEAPPKTIALSEQEPEIKIYMTVVSWSNWYDRIVRSKPGANGLNVARLDPGDQVRWTGRKEFEFIPGKPRAEWYEVSGENFKGWILAAVLQKERGSSLNRALLQTTAFPGVPTTPRGPRYCADAFRLRGEPLPVHVAPDPHSRTLVRLPPRSCTITSTGAEFFYPDPSGSALWLEVLDDAGTIGWVSAFYLSRSR